MTTFAPVETLADLATLDDAEVMEGYWSGRANDPEPGNNHSRSFWHGWRNGASDAGHREIDPAQCGLVAVYLADQRARKAK